MAESVVAICNRALDYLGQAPIISLLDGTPPAAVLSRSYPLARDKVLRSYPWNSATTRAALPLMAEKPAYEFSNQYLLPPDCLRVLNVQDEIEGLRKWRVEGRRILCSEPAPLRIRYIRRIEDVAELDPMLADAIAARLAADCAYTITGSSSTVDMMEVIYDRAWRVARRIDAQEQSSDDVITADDWLISRM